MLAQGIPHQPMVSPSCFFVLLRIDEIWDDPPICILKEGYWKTVIPSLQLHIPLIVFLCAVAFTNNHSKLTTAHTTHCVSLCCWVYKQSFQAYNCTYHSLCFFVLLRWKTVIPSLQLHIPLTSYVQAQFLGELNLMIPQHWLLMRQPTFCTLPNGEFRSDGPC